MRRGTHYNWARRTTTLMSENIFTVTFRSVGPVTRTTVGEGQPDPEGEALGDALHWIWCWHLQVDRLHESTLRVTGSGTPIESRRASSRTSYEEHILLVAGWNLARALNRAQPYMPQASISEETGQALRLLRDLYEHWDEQRSAFQVSDTPKVRSAKTLAKLFPEARPWTMVFTSDDWLLGGVVGIGELSKALVPIEHEVLRLEEERMHSLHKGT
jgi:hypothetical protein